MKAHRSPALVGLMLGLVAGAGAVAAIATTESGGGTRSATRPTGTPGPKIVVSLLQGPNSGAAAPLESRAPLPSLAGHARGYRLSSQPPPGAIERLADALGVHGAVDSDTGGWTVREDNRLLRVAATAGLPWYFSVLQGPCSMVPSEALPGVPPSGPTDCPEAEGPPSGPVRPPDLPGRDDALAFGMETLGRAGLGVSRPVIVDQGSSWHIETGPLVAGKLTSGLGWTITVGPGRTVVAASGFLAGPAPAQSYRLVGTAKGLQRARAISGGTVTGVQLGLMLGRLGDAAYLVPAYLFELQGPAGAPPPVVAVPAVEDRYLA